MHIGQSRRGGVGSCASQSSVMSQMGIGSVRRCGRQRVDDPAIEVFCRCGSVSSYRPHGHRQIRPESGANPSAVDKLP